MLRLKNQGGFTLIELLIVVAIIAILALIAVPNFLEAQTRSKVARVKADFRSFATALESYCVDNNIYPLNWNLYGGWPTHFSIYALNVLTTPVSYFSDVFHFRDPFQPVTFWNPYRSFLYFNHDYFPAPMYCWLREAHGDEFAHRFGHPAWLLVSWGPDRQQNEAEHLEHYPYCPGNKGILYDPTNGTISAGDVIRGGGATWLKAD